MSAGRLVGLVHGPSMTNLSRLALATPEAGADPSTAGLAQSATDDPTSAQYDPEIPSGTAGSAAGGGSVAE